MNRKAGPSIIVSFLIVCVFAVVLFPGNSRRSSTSMPRNPVAGPVVSSPSGAKPAPPTVLVPGQLVRSSTDAVAPDKKVAEPMPIDPPGKVASIGVVSTTATKPTSKTSAQSTRSTQAVPASSVGLASPMGRMESIAARRVASTGRGDDQGGREVRIAAKETIRPETHTWSLVPPKVSKEKAGNAR